MADSDAVARTLLFSPPSPPGCLPYGEQRLAVHGSETPPLVDRAGWLSDEDGFKSTATFRAPIDYEDEEQFDDVEDYEDTLAARYCSSAGGVWAAAGGAVAEQQWPGTAAAVAALNAAAAGTVPAMQHPAQAALVAHERGLQAGALCLAEQQQRRLTEQLQSVERDLATQLAAVRQQLANKRAAAAAADEDARQRHSAERNRRLAEVQRQHAALQQAQATALQEVQRAQQQQAARRAAEAEAAAREAEATRCRREQEAAAAAKRAAEEASAKAAAAARATAAASAAAVAKQQQQQQALTTTVQGQGQGKPSVAPQRSLPGTAPRMRATRTALEHEARLAARLAAAEDAAQELRTNPALKPQRRALEKQITMAVSQISGTQQQVQAKAQQLAALLRGAGSPGAAAFAQLTLAARIVSQCEGQVSKIGSFAFPLAYVCVAVGAAEPAFMDLLLAKLHQASPLLVPKYPMYCASMDKEAWYASLGYKQVDATAGAGASSGATRRETQDEFVSRVGAMALLYGAIVQTDAPGNPAGLTVGWAWLARSLNALPPTRPTAACMMAFLSHAGHRLSAVYRRQFSKLLSALDEQYLPGLEAKAAKDPDLRAVGTRLQTYVQTGQWREEPEGRTLKKVDESAYLRA